nr:DNA polymerase III subunit beta [Pseudomonas sp. CFBP 13727]
MEKTVRPADAIRGKEVEIQRLIETYGFTEPNLFDSVARGDDHKGNYLDLLVTIPPAMVGKISLFDVFEFEDEFRALVGVPVDLHIHNNISEHFRQSIEREMFTL